MTNTTVTSEAREESGFLKTKKNDILSIDFNRIKIVDKYNARKDMGDIEELCNSIIENGVQTPLTGFKEKGTEFYILVGGHRRCEAIKLAISLGAGIERVPFIIKANMNDVDMTVDLIISNSGKPLNNLEEADVYKRLTNYGLTVDEIARKVGKSVPLVYNLLKMNSFNHDVKEAVNKGEISASNALALSRKAKTAEDLSNDVAVAISLAKSEGKKKATSKNMNSLINVDRTQRMMNIVLKEYMNTPVYETFKLFYDLVEAKKAESKTSVNV